MKAIRTRYVGPSNVKGSRVIADDSDGNRVTLSWDSALDSDGNHHKAVHTLCDKMGWKGELIGGEFKNAQFWVFTER